MATRIDVGTNGTSGIRGAASATPEPAAGVGVGETAVADRAFRIDYYLPEEPTDIWDIGETEVHGERVVAAVVTLNEQSFPLVIRGFNRGRRIDWQVGFGDISDEGLHDTFAAALRVAHDRALGCARELIRALTDGGY